MRLKKGFTLAEILIVLMVIGAIATMTVPSLMRGVTEAQWKTAYKKAFNSVLNMAAIERVSGITMTASNNANVKTFYTIIYNNLSTSGGAKAPSTFEADTNDYSSEIKTATAPKDLGDTAPTPWIIGDDKIAYSVLNVGTCDVKQTINNETTPAGASGKACVTIGVDTNGLLTGPNITDKQVGTGAAALTTGTNMETLVGERFYIYVASDGVTAGNAQAVATGRIVNDVK